MKRLIMAIFVTAIGAVLYAQNSFFPSKVGIVLTYANNDARGNTQSYTVLTIKDVKGSGNNMTITYVGSALDKNRRIVKDSEATYKAVIKNGVVIMDINYMVPREMKEGGIKVEAKGTPTELPSDMKVGQALKASNITITADIGGRKMTTVAKYEGKCLAIENVKVPAGTFKCHKISERITTNTMGVTVVSTSVSWLAPNIGTVKSETYDEKNKLVSGSVLTELKGK